MEMGYGTSAGGDAQQKLHAQQRGGICHGAEMWAMDPSNSAWEQGPFNVGSLFLGVGFQVQEGTALSLSACQTTTEKLTISFNT